MSLLDRLRTETRDGHLRVETDLDLLSEGLTLECYASVLQRLQAFVGRWEPAVERLLGATFYAPRRKEPWLDADLRHLRMPRWRAEVPMPVLADRAQALGSLYVLEGGTLGGQVILRHLRAIGLPVGGATAYFASYGRDVGRNWAEFRTVLLDASGPGQDAVIIRSARDTFGVISALMRQPPLPALVPSTQTSAPAGGHRGGKKLPPPEVSFRHG